MSWTGAVMGAASVAPERPVVNAECSPRHSPQTCGISSRMGPLLRALGILAAIALPAQNALGHAVHGKPRMPKPPRGEQMTIGPVAVPSGKEVTECTYLKMPGRREMAVNRVRIKVKGGSHHIHLYRPADRTRDIPDGHETCNFAVNFDEGQLGR